MSAGLLAPADIMNHQIADLGIPVDSLSSGAALVEIEPKGIIATHDPAWIEMSW